MAAMGGSRHIGRPGQDVKRQPWVTIVTPDVLSMTLKGLPLRQVEQSVAGDSHEEQSVAGDSHEEQSVAGDSHEEQLVAGDSHEEGWRQESASG